MTLSNDDVAAGVRRYLKTVETGTAADVTALFAADATVEDPVGTEARHGHDAIRELYASFEAMSRTTELLALRTCGGQAAFWFRIVVDLGGGATSTLEPMETMVFDDAGLVTAMRAFWSDGDLTLASPDRTAPAAPHP
jgi:steroid Delta-isomerase